MALKGNPPCFECFLNGPEMSKQRHLRKTHQFGGGGPLKCTFLKGPFLGIERETRRSTTISGFSPPHFLRVGADIHVWVNQRVAWVLWDFVLTGRQPESQSKPGTKMVVIPEPCTGLRSYGWDRPLLTFVYPGFDCGSPETAAAHQGDAW